MAKRLIVMTYDIAMAAAKDAGNCSMGAHGRVAWNADDWNAVCREFERLWPVSADLDVVSVRRVA